jgi:hypothetical protein
MNCPRHGTPLEPRTYASLVDGLGCPGCKGLWLDFETLETMQETMAGDFAEELRQLPEAVLVEIELARNERMPVLMCPSCSGQMDRRDHRDCERVRVDVCPRCRGLWLGGGELAALEGHFEESSVSAEELRRAFLGGLHALMGADV